MNPTHPGEPSRRYFLGAGLGLSALVASGAGGAALLRHTQLTQRERLALKHYQSIYGTPDSPKFPPVTYRHDRLPSPPVLSALAEEIKLLETTVLEATVPDRGAALERSRMSHPSPQHLDRGARFAERIRSASRHRGEDPTPHPRPRFRHSPALAAATADQADKFVRSTVRELVGRELPESVAVIIHSRQEVALAPWNGHPGLTRPIEQRIEVSDLGNFVANFSLQIHEWGHLLNPLLGDPHGRACAPADTSYEPEVAVRREAVSGLFGLLGCSLIENDTLRQQCAGVYYWMAHETLRPMTGDSSGLHAQGFALLEVLRLHNDDPLDIWKQLVSQPRLDPQVMNDISEVRSLLIYHKWLLSRISGER